MAKDQKAVEFVRFTGTGNRVISEADWAGIECTDQKDASWDTTNAKRLPASDFSPRALNYLLKVDGEFVLEELEK